MLSRGASDASSRLRRSKSSTSVNRRRIEPLVKETIDPETARRHAVAAAHIAMHRASERASIEIGRSTGSFRKRGNESTTGTGATPRAQNIHLCHVIEARRLRSALLSKGPVAASAACMPGSKSFSQLSKIGQGPPLDEFGVTDGYGSTPSSYRRLRKSKSMLTPRKRDLIMPDLASQSPGTPRTLRNVKSSLSNHDHGLRLGFKRSMSFLKSGSGNLSKQFARSNSTSAPNDAAVEQAREQFIQNAEQQRLQTKSVVFPTPQFRQQKAFRKTVRSNQNKEYGDGIGPDNQQTKQESKFRSFSASLRDRVRRALGKSAGKDGNLPAQQLDASRAHFGDYLNGTNVHTNHEVHATDDVQFDSRRSFYVPTSLEQGSAEDLEAITKSVGSVYSNDCCRSNGQSRVTSWTNSTMTNTLAGRGTPIEKKRLSIIQEYGGPHRPSSSIGRHMDEVSATHVPLSARQGNGQFTTPIDSQRVYSALIKRIKQDQEEPDTDKTPTSGPSQEKTQIYTEHFAESPTVRQVASGKLIHTLVTDPQLRQFSSRTPVRHEIDGKTPQQIALENETLEEQKPCVPLLATKFSPSHFSSENGSQAQSPVTEAPAESHERPISSDDGNGSIIINRPIPSGNGFDISSDSLYSRTTSGQLPSAGRHWSNPESMEESPGSAPGLPDQAKGGPRSIDPFTSLRKAKSNASLEWKTWMKSHRTSLERRDSRTCITHYREGAQIDGEDTAIGGGHGLSALRRGRHPPSAAKVSVTSTKGRRALISNERFPLLDLKEVPKNDSLQPRRSSSAMRLASLNSKTAGLAVSGVNNENARIPSPGTAAPYPLRPRYSEMSLKHGKEFLCTPGRWRHQHQQPSAGLRKPQSMMTIKSQYDRITEMSEAEEPELYVPSTTSRLNRPLDNNGYNVSGTNTVGSQGFLAPSPSLGMDNCDLYDKDPPLMRKPTLAGEKRHHRAGMGLPISSKRMVSNFLRSRRRNGCDFASGESGPGIDDEPSPVFV